MPFALDKRDRMFNARNLNGLYARFDQKCARVLDGKSPKVAKKPYDEPSQFEFGLDVPYGVTYTYTLITEGAYLENYDQAQASVELSKLENAHLDTAGGQIYVDKYPIAGESFTCDVKQIHFSFELLRREVDGVLYDVHLGWDENGALNSYVRGSLGADVPTLPPGRIHKHKVAVAEIELKGPREFRIFNTYQRFDCWRVHNLSDNTATVFLQNPDGSSQRESVGPYGCRSFRRKADGTWATTWPSGSQCQYFFPFFRGDVPYFAGGPPMYDWPVSPFVAHERSERANNVANPFVLTQWFRALGGWHDPFIPFDIRQTYPDVYGDPENANTPIGDLIFSWGRARVQVYNTLTNAVIADYMKVFRDTNLFVETLRSIGVEVEQIGGALGLRTVEGNTGIRIYPVDCNVFFTDTLPYWEISPTLAYFSTVYPKQAWTQNLLNPLSATSWTAGNEPDWFETMRTLRRRVAVEEGFLNAYDDEVDISEEKVSRVSLTPLGLMVRAATAVGILSFDANAMSDLPSYERTANKFELWTESQAAGFSPAIGWSGTRYTSGVKVYYLQTPASSSGWYKHVFPNLSAPASDYFPAVDCGYVPVGGPWGFSSSVYDANLSRVYSTDPNDPVIENVHGSDFWVNKWGGAGGVDATVRILGQPNQTLQLPVQTTTATPDLVADDIFKDLNAPTMAGLAPWTGSITANTGFNQSHLAEIRWRDTDQYFNLPYVVQSDAINYTLNGAFYHKIPKTAYLWNLLEWTVRAWTRAIPLCLGEVACPINGFDGSGNLEPSRLGIQIPKDLTTTGIEGGQAVFYLSEAQHNVCLANGIVSQTADDPSGNPYWYVSQSALAGYCGSKGFNAYNFDATNAQPNLVTPIAATAWIPLRAYGVGETVEIASYFDDILNQEYYRAVRYVSLRLPNELSA